MIQMVNVDRIYKKQNVVALKNINLAIDKGEFVFLTGASGAGKSTMIRLLFREELATSGQVIVAGRSLSRLSSKETVIFRRNVGMVFQDSRLLEDKTVEENVAFAMRVIERPKKEIDKKVPEILERVGLKNRLKHFPHQLSGGEKQRVAVARAIINDPIILFADEPTGNLDPDTSEELMELLREINDSGTTIIMATHDRNLVDTMQKRVLVLEKGRLISDRIGGWSL
ncbi:MAG: cell division ATP-binding protein FtsE [Peptococcaceae bacterium]|nr:cell division ATP-binding protein FtsE [Peptococcaceae bacterium]